MPEGDTVWLAGQRLNQALAGSPLLRTDFRVPSLAEVDLTGRVVGEVVSRGKHLLIRIPDADGSPSLTIHTHFRMDGSWHLYRSGESWKGGSQWQIRVVLRTEQWLAVGYRLPVLELLPTADELNVVGHLGPDLLGPDWDLAQAVARLASQPDAELGLALLDQRNLAGIGNLYKTEICFLAGVSPWITVGEVLNDLPRIVSIAKRLLDINKDRVVQSTTGDLQRGRWHWAFERTGQPCRRCGSRVLLSHQGEPPRQRLAYWCPRCQPGPHPGAIERRELGPRPIGRTRYRP